MKICSFEKSNQEKLPKTSHFGEVGRGKFRTISCCCHLSFHEGYQRDVPRCQRHHHMVGSLLRSEQKLVFVHISAQMTTAIPSPLSHTQVPGNRPYIVIVRHISWSCREKH
ncbi:hypothetical protein PoB_005782500 [Plakobranchus ocellatus]|uniref:Uncharacterized protein n=1 Tax=Plakobranchus ocellatus TaxID=259542 RepID=A0AAV4CIB3_9GAST|nr:hypothetical protein PoB_005782500 [Plakobranchus ocellatus]